LASPPAFATDFTVNSDATLRAALSNAVAGDSITFTANISTVSDLPAITQSITVNGNNFTLSGANSTANGNSALFVFSGTVAINNLTISQVTAQGGAGGHGGGGGAGLGGALFVGAQANVTVSNVSLLNNVAQGGNGGAPAAVVGGGGGGGGGLGGAGGNAARTGGGGGGGVGNPGVGGSGRTAGSNGNLTGQNSGIVVDGAGANGGGGLGGTPSHPGAGGGGAGATLSSNSDGGAGGFGGGGGGGAGSGNGGDARTRPGNFTTLAGVSTFNLASPGAAGNGGFGGGGGGAGGRTIVTGGGDGGFGGGGGEGRNAAGSGGVGGGAGDAAAGNGGGGLAAGGAIFVQEGGTLTIAGTFTANGNSVLAGTGGGGTAGNGLALGSGIFLQGNNTIVFQPASGQTQTVADVITDQNGSLGSGGSGALTLNGPGTLVLSAVDTYTGPTTVTVGTLAVTGSIANSIATVSNGGTLAGSGTVGGLVAQSGGTVAPGALSPFTTLNVSGNASFAPGSIFLVNINPAGQNDKLLVTGTATLTGGTVQVLAGTGTFSPTSRFILLTANGGVSGAFANLTTSTNLAFLSPVLSEDANDVILSFTSTPPGVPPAPTFPSVAITPSQKSTATAVQALGSGPIFNAVIGQSVAGALQAFNALSGEIHATAVSAGFEDDRLPREAILDRLSQPLATPLLGVASTMTGAYAADLPTRKGPPVAPIDVRMYQPRLFDLWGQGFGDWGRAKGDGNAASFDRSTGGFIIGGDASAIGFAGSEWRLGAAGGYTDDTVHVGQRLSSADFENVFGAIYAGASYGAVHLRAGAIYGSNSLSTSRSIVFPGFSDAAASNSGGTTAQAFGEAGYRVDVPNMRFGGVGGIGVSHMTLEPFVGAAAIEIHLNGFNEIGGPAALTGLARNFEFATTTLGLRAQGVIDAPVPLTAHALIGWRRAYGDLVPSVFLAFQNASQSFSVAGVPIDRDTFLAEAGLDYAVTSAFKIGVSYSGQYGQRAFDNAFKAQLDVSF
jgi:outer membrane autotransporter protein